MTEATAPKTANATYASVPLADVRVGNRYRRDYGDMPALADSMAELGQLQPIGLNRQNELLWGRRRLKAAEILEWPTIAAVVVDCDPGDKTLVEYHENVYRKEFTNSEKVEIGKALERAAGERRGRPSSGAEQGQENIPRKCGELKPGQETAQAAAQAAGFGSDDTYRRAKTVAESGNTALISLVDDGKVSVAMGAQVVKLPEEKQRQFVAAVVGGKTPAAALKAVTPEDDPLHVNQIVQEWIANGTLTGATKDAVLNLGGNKNGVREEKQSQFVRRVKEGMTYGQALESVRKGGKRDAATKTTKPAETDEEKDAAKQEGKEAIGTLWQAMGKLGLLNEWRDVLNELTAQIEAV